MRLAILSGKVLLIVGFAAWPGALGLGGRWPESEGGDGECHRDPGDGSLVAALPGEHPLRCWHVLAAVQPAEHVQHPGEMGIRPERADFDAAELALLAIAEAQRMLLTCGLLRDAAPAGYLLRDVRSQ